MDKQTNPNNETLEGYLDSMEYEGFPDIHDQRPDSVWYTYHPENHAAYTTPYTHSELTPEEAQISWLIDFAINKGLLDNDDIAQYSRIIDANQYLGERKWLDIIDFFENKISVIEDNLLEHHGWDITDYESYKIAKYHKSTEGKLTTYHVIMDSLSRRVIGITVSNREYRENNLIIDTTFVSPIREDSDGAITSICSQTINNEPDANEYSNGIAIQRGISSSLELAKLCTDAVTKAKYPISSDNSTIPDNHADVLTQIQALTLDLPENTDPTNPLHNNSRTDDLKYPAGIMDKYSAQLPPDLSRYEIGTQIPKWRRSREKLISLTRNLAKIPMSTGLSGIKAVEGENNDPYGIIKTIIDTNNPDRIEITVQTGELMPTVTFSYNPLTDDTEIILEYFDSKDARKLKDPTTSRKWPRKANISNIVRMASTNDYIELYSNSSRTEKDYVLNITGDIIQSGIHTIQQAIAEYTRYIGPNK